MAASSLYKLMRPGFVGSVYYAQNVMPSVSERENFSKTINFQNNETKKIGHDLPRVASLSGAMHEQA